MVLVVIFYYNNDSRMQLSSGAIACARRIYIYIAGYEAYRGVYLNLDILIKRGREITCCCSKTNSR